jgi:hypothetical protein
LKNEIKKKIQLEKEKKIMLISQTYGGGHKYKYSHKK